MTTVAENHGDVNVEALLKLADALEQPLPENMTFDITRWWSKFNCTTVCCAAGLASSLPWFNLLGLSHDENGMPIFHDRESGMRLSGFDAVEAVFGLTTCEARWLFDGESYHQDKVHRDRFTWTIEVQPFQVARRLRSFAERVQAGKPGVPEHVDETVGRCL